MVCKLYTYGMYTYGMYTYGMYTYGMYTYGMYTYGMYTYGMYTYGLCSCTFGLSATKVSFSTMGSHLFSNIKKIQMYFQK